MQIKSFTKFTRSGWLLALLFISTGGAFAQGGASGTITGLVHDQSGASISGAQVTLTNLGTGIKKKTTTNAEGYYTFPLLLPGRYQIIVAQQGFKSITQTAVPLEVAQTARVDFALEVGAITEKVIVTAAGPLLQTENAALGTVIGQTSVVGLPLNGRNFTQLATLSNGVTTVSSSTNLNGTVLRSSGMHPSDMLYTIGGASATDAHFSGIPLLPAPDAIEEFRLQTNDMSAEYGEGGGTVVNVELKSGTNRFHGDVYEFLRNDALAARDYFAVTKPVLKQNQFGFTLGGPIIRNQTFFFVDYQGTRIRSGNTFNDIVATTAMQGGDFSALGKPIIDPQTQKQFPGNIIPPNRLSPEATFFLKFMPTPNTPDGTYVHTASAVQDRNQFDIRVDHTFKSADALDVAYSFQQGPIISPGAFPDVGGLNRSYKSQLANIRETHTFSSTFFNEFGYSYFRATGWQTPQGLGTNYTVQSGIGGFDSTSELYPGFPVFNISGYTQFGIPTYPLLSKDNMFILKDSLTLIRGSHTIKAGGLARWWSFNSLNAANSRGNFTFNGTYTSNGFADFLLGLPFRGARDFPRNLFGGREHDQYFFVQDDWKINPKLTLNLGLRYELHHPRVPKDNAGASFNPYTDQLVVSSDSKGNMNFASQQVSQYASQYSQI